MKKLQNITLLISVFLLSFGCASQMPNEKTISARVDGNCDMCKETIETAAFKKDIAVAVWNKDTKVAVIKFDSVATSAADILKRIAAVGYDNEQFLAPDTAYKSRPGCCQYERVLKNKLAPAEKKDTIVKDSVLSIDVEASPLFEVFDLYFELKDALVKSDSKAAMESARGLKELLTKINENQIEQNKSTLLISLTSDISSSTKLAFQREKFATLSKVMYDIAKVSKLNTIVYYQHCPMYNNGKGGNWLSKEKAIKNPLYGSEMLTCGSVIETIK